MPPTFGPHDEIVHCLQSSPVPGPSSHGYPFHYRRYIGRRPTTSFG